ncbi:MAG: hypothetical protein ACTHMM_05480 [Agriterribacter sp.]
MRMTRHMHINIEGFLRNHKGQSIGSYFQDEKGQDLDDAEARNFLSKCLAKGWKKIPFGNCVGFDHFEHGCPGHPAQEELWFDFVIKNKKHWAHGFTVKRLQKVREAVMDDNNIMFDLLQRHGGDKLIPEQMREKDVFTFDHCIGNFTCNILYKMMDTGVYNPKK